MAKGKPATQIVVVDGALMLRKKNSEGDIETVAPTQKLGKGKDSPVETISITGLPNTPKEFVARAAKEDTFAARAFAAFLRGLLTTGQTKVRKDNDVMYTIRDKRLNLVSIPAEFFSKMISAEIDRTNTENMLAVMTKENGKEVAADFTPLHRAWVNAARIRNANGSYDKVVNHDEKSGQYSLSLADGAK